MHKCTCIVHDRASVRFQGRMIESSSSFLGCKWAAAVAEFVSVTKGSDCCPSPVAFRFAVDKNTSSFWHKAAASSRSLFFFAGSYLAFSIGAGAQVLSMN